MSHNHGMSRTAEEVTVAEALERVARSVRYYTENTHEQVAIVNRVEYVAAFVYLSQLMQRGSVGPAASDDPMFCALLAAEQDAREQRARAEKAEQERDAAGLKWGEHYSRTLAAVEAERDALALQLAQENR